jgi:nucleoside-diphosphate-sugar epimerase
VSSIGVNGDVSDERGFSEESVVAPVKDYAVSKYEAELGLRELAEGSGTELVVVRPPLVYGVGVRGKSDLYQQLFGSLVVQNIKAREVLGWVPVGSARDNLAKVGKWFRSL